MFIRKELNGFYYVYFTTEDGLRKKMTTKCRKKSDALLFLSKLSERDSYIEESESTSNRIKISEYTKLYVEHACKKASDPKATYNGVYRFVNDLMNIHGDVYLNDLTVYQLEKFIYSFKSVECVVMLISFLDHSFQLQINENI